MNRASVIRRSNIVSTEWNGERNVGCYLGNGRFGAIMSGLGLNLSPEQQNDSKYNPSHFNHMSHWGRFHFFSRHMQAESTVDYILPLYKLYWSDEFGNISDYHQCHDLYDGVLYTDYKLGSDNNVHIQTWFDAVNKDIAGVTVDTGGEISQRICLSARTLIDPCWFVCGKKFAQSWTAEKLDDGWRMVITCEETTNNSATIIYISTNMNTEIGSEGLIFNLQKGKNYLLMSVGTPIHIELPEVSLQRTREWWHKAWQDIGWIEYSDRQMQNIFTRGIAYLLSSYDAISGTIQPANCMGIGGYAYNFVPDIENIAPVLLMMGRQDIVKHWVENFAGEIEGLYRYAKHLWPDAEGIFPPWELNYGPIDGYHFPKVPILFCYEAHNTGYLCRLAMEAAEFANDDVWAKTYAYPLIRGCAEFFRSACHKEEDGLWHLKWYPCMGRDEAGGINKEDYLCTLLTAKYSFQSAIKCGLDEGADYRQILEDGLAFESLISERGTWHTCRGADDFGRQKHPIQLEGIACFPTESSPQAPEIEAYNLRYEITSGAKKPRFCGWTLAQLLMADTNMKNYPEWARDWSLLRPSDNIDENWIQFYESSGSIRSPFYLATHSMTIQSLIRNCVNDYWGCLDIGACLSDDACVKLENIRTRLGVSVSGVIEDGAFVGTVTALRNCEVTIGEAKLNMKQGETQSLELILK